MQYMLRYKWLTTVYILFSAQLSLWCWSGLMENLLSRSARCCERKVEVIEQRRTSRHCKDSYLSYLRMEKCWSDRTKSSWRAWSCSCHSSSSSGVTYTIQLDWRSRRIPAHESSPIISYSESIRSFPCRWSIWSGQLVVERADFSALISFRYQHLRECNDVLSSNALTSSRVTVSFMHICTGFLQKGVLVLIPAWLMSPCARGEPIPLLYDLWTAYLTSAMQVVSDIQCLMLDWHAQELDSCYS